MRIAILAAAFAVGVWVSSGAAHAAGVPDVAGNWKHPNGAIVAFYDCEGDLCAKIATPTDPAKTDVMNPDESKRKTPLTGLVILTHGKKSGDAAWKCDLYNSEDGKTYSGYVSLLAPDQLQLKGCALVVFCRSIVFTKAP